MIKRFALGNATPTSQKTLKNMGHFNRWARLERPVDRKESLQMQLKGPPKCSVIGFFNRRNSGPQLTLCQISS